MRSPMWPTSKTTIRTWKSATAAAAFATTRTRLADCRRTTSSALRNWIRSPGCEIRRLPQRVADEETLQERAAIGQQQRTTGQRRYRTGTLRQHAVERVDRELHQLILAFAPALVRAQSALRTQMVPRSRRLQRQLRQRGRIQ